MFGGVYRAKAVTAYANGAAQVQIPQLYGDTLVTVTRFVNYPFTTPLMGWVMFEGADSSFPVWLSGDTLPESPL